ncbi:hypothetical protein Y032_0011g1234 [Ancylostoma ceylanicum]|uniref:Uncharacterized protein n=1 Tax=Ancylostoma ceylanicum TaxID=53326 RepID=A0A016VDJ3_9BILA|nr:hypothetical protein Y032_0011g1234 [Ancylostoma ceylanicum]
MLFPTKLSRNPFLRDQFILARTSSSARKVHVLPYTFADLIDGTGVLIAKRRETPRTPAEDLCQFSAGVREVRHCL